MNSLHVNYHIITAIGTLAVMNTILFNHGRQISIMSLESCQTGRNPHGRPALGQGALIIHHDQY